MSSFASSTPHQTTTTLSNYSPQKPPQQQQPNASVSIFQQLGVDERSVISTLCKLRSHSNSNRTSAEKSLQNGKPSCSSAVTDQAIRRERSRQSSVMEEDENDDALPLTSQRGSAKNGNARRRAETDQKTKEKDAKLSALQNNHPLNATNFSELRSLWRLCDRNIDSALSNNYDEISAFFAACEPDMASKPTNQYSERQRRHTQENSLEPPSAKIGSNVQCRIFDSYEQFENARDSVRLLPALCAYSQSAKKMLDSLRLNLRAYSAFKLGREAAKSSSNSFLNEKCKELNGQWTEPAVEPISALRLQAFRSEPAQQESDELFKAFSERVKNVPKKPLDPQHSNGEMKDGNLTASSLDKEFSNLLEVCGLMDALLDTVTTTNQNSSTYQNAVISKNLPTSLNESASSDMKNNTAILCSQAAVADPEKISAFLIKLPQIYRELIESRRRTKALNNHRFNGARIRKAHRTKCCDLSGSSDMETNEPEDDLAAKRLFESRRADFLMQTLHESNDRAQKKCKTIRKAAVKILSKFEEERYAQYVKELNGAARQGQDTQIAFLMDLPKYKSNFKPLVIYNTNASLTLRPPKHLVNRLFKGRHPYCCKRPFDVENKVSDEREQTDDDLAAKHKLSSVERLREKEAARLLLDDLEEITENRASIADMALKHLRMKYLTNKTTIEMPIKAENGLALQEELLNIKERTESARSESNTPPTLYNTSIKSALPIKRRVNHLLNNSKQSLYYKDRCRHAHEMAATVFGLAHYRANLARQCLESMMELVQLTATTTPSHLRTSTNHPQKQNDNASTPAAGAANFESDCESDMRNTDFALDGVAAEGNDAFDDDRSCSMSIHAADDSHQQSAKNLNSHPNSDEDEGVLGGGHGIRTRISSSSPMPSSMHQNQIKKRKWRVTAKRILPSRSMKGVALSEMAAVAASQPQQLEKTSAIGNSTTPPPSTNKSSYRKRSLAAVS